METRNILDSEDNIIGEMSLPEGTSEEIWLEKLSPYLNIPSSPTIEQLLAERVKWGVEIVKQFRLYSMGIPDEQGLQLLGNMIDVKMSLELGMLSSAAYLLSNKPEDEFLDAQFSETDSRSIRQRFIDMILYEGPTP